MSLVFPLTGELLAPADPCRGVRSRCFLLRLQRSSLAGTGHQVLEFRGSFAESLSCIPFNRATGSTHMGRINGAELYQSQRRVLILRPYSLSVVSDSAGYLGFGALLPGSDGDRAVRPAALPGSRRPI